MAVLTVPEAKAHLRIADSASDALVTAFILTAEATIARHVGPLESTSTTCRVVPNGARLALPTTPAISLTSVTPADGAALTIGDLYLNTTAGVVTYNSGASFTARYYDVVYAAGRSPCPADLLMAVKEQLRSMWEGSQRGDAVAIGEEEYVGDTVASAEWALSFEVSRLIAPHVQAGFA